MNTPVSGPSASPAFSPFKAAMAAAVWGPVPIAVYVLATAFFGQSLLGDIQKSIAMAILWSLSLWLMAYLLRNKPQWWRMRIICPLIVLVVFFVTILGFVWWRGLPIQVIATVIWHHGITSLIPRETYRTFALISLVVGIPTSFGAARYYRKTHPPGLTASSSNDSH
jgi:hypothetical protein